MGAGRRRGACRRGFWATCTGKRVADLCAAPGGKTAQLAAAGAPGHCGRPRAEAARPARDKSRAPAALARKSVAADVTQWQAGPFDAVLLDAPCSSTGTIRRHPDIPWLKRASDIAALAAVQRRMLDARLSSCEARRHPRLLHLLARAGGRRATDRARSARSEPRPRRRPIAAGEAPRPRRAGSRRRRPAHAALPLARPGSAHGRAWTASMPPVCKGFGRHYILGWPL